MKATPETEPWTGTAGSGASGWRSRRCRPSSARRCPRQRWLTRGGHRREREARRRRPRAAPARKLLAECTGIEVVGSEAPVFHVDVSGVAAGQDDGAAEVDTVDTADSRKPAAPVKVASSVERLRAVSASRKASTASSAAVSRCELRSESARPTRASICALLAAWSAVACACRASFRCTTAITPMPMATAASTEVTPARIRSRRVRRRASPCSRARSCRPASTNAASSVDRCSWATRSTAASRRDSVRSAARPRPPPFGRPPELWRARRSAALRRSTP